MSVAEQSLAEFQAVLDRHRANESAYKDRLKEINLTRGKIADQLEALQQTYDKKLRGLEQKLEALRGQNDSLARENTLYRSEIETYQSRLLEKEKIIAALLAQRRDLPVVASSDKSKSEKTDSLNANEEESKAFKKQPLFKQDYEHPVSTLEKFKQDTTSERLSNHTDAPAPQKVEKTAEKPHEVKPPPQKTVPLPVLPQVVNQEILPIVEQPVQKTIEQTNQVEFVALPVPSRVKPGKPKQQPKKKNPPVPVKTKYMRHQKAKPLDANNFFSSLAKQEVAQQVKVSEEQENVAHASHHSEQEQIIVTAQAEPELLPEQEAQESHYPQQEVEVINYAPQFEAEQEQLQQYQQQEPEYQHEEAKYQQISPSKDDHSAEEQAYNDQEEQGNFLSHFNQAETETENYYQPYPLKKKTKAKRAKAASAEVVVEAVEQEATGSDFFAQLSRAEHEPHQLDNIEESSIDHIDRDNSLLSNEQPYFAVEAEAAPKRAVKMSKKKKRDQIKMMDPSCFD